MTVETGGGGPYSGPPSLDELLTLRTDYEDVPVPAFGGKEVRVFALTGVARVRLIAEVRGILREAGLDPENIPDDLDEDIAVQFAERIEQHQARVVAASMGYPPEQWDEAGGSLPGDTVELLYGVATRLSGLGPDERKQEKDRQPKTRSTASGSD